MHSHDLSIVPPNVRTRWASAENWSASPGAGGKALGGRKGSPSFVQAAGETRVLAHASGSSGCVRRIWLTINDRSPAALRGMRLRMFWDGASTPAVDSPLGDFFCQGLGRTVTFENALFSNPEGRSFNTTVPMPFRTGFRIELINETGAPMDMVFYDVDFTLGDEIGPGTCYFHAHWRREVSGVLGQDYTILPQVRGRGRFLGACFSVIPNKLDHGTHWWGEGEVKAFIDGDGEFPTLCGTGTEDYIGTAWGQGAYANQWQGCPIADGETFRYAFYRLHGPDPIYFHEGFRATIQRIGHDGKALFEREGDDWASCAWFYLNKPENGLPALAAVAERVAGL